MTPRIIILLVALGLGSDLAAGLAVSKQSARISRGGAANETDSLALVQFYHATRGEYWTQNTNWLTGQLDSWYGVVVTEERVTRLELPDNSLDNASAEILPIGSLGNLEYLEVLDLQMNSIGGTVPASITTLHHLKEVYLNNNFFDELPDLAGLDDLTDLTVFNVQSNRLTFEDFEDNLGPAHVLVYAPQYRISVSGYTGLFQGDTVMLQARVGGAANEYQWYFDDQVIDGANSDTYVIEDLSEEHKGSYVLEVTNPLVPDLVLESVPRALDFGMRLKQQWLDIGEYHHSYTESGARVPGDGTPEGMEYPAILRHSGHTYARGFWVGVRDWTDVQGGQHPYYVSRVGPGNLTPSNHTFPVQHKLIGRYEDTIVEVNGRPSIDKEASLDEVDPTIAADRMVHNIHNMSVGITVDRKVYAYTNPFHDNYHIIEYTYCNTGNVDADAEIELPDQTLHDVMFFRVHRWRGNEQAAWISAPAQAWGRFTMSDVVGDGHETYPVDFTAQYAWAGYDFVATSQKGYSNLGAPLFTDADTLWVARGDSVGRLAGPTMAGRSTIHADRSTVDRSHDRNQPSTMAWLDNDGMIYHAMSTDEDHYRLGILAGESINRNAECINCTPRVYPHFADYSRPDGEFWEYPPTNTLTGGFAGGFSPTTGYGPYEMGPGACVQIVVSEGVAGLSFDAATKIGRAYKRGGLDRDNLVITYDANSNGTINPAPFNYNEVYVGTEAQTKNQWYLSARDSLFQMFERASRLYAASNQMAAYPIAEPPRPPTHFSLRGWPEYIELAWRPASGGPGVDHWELFRTENWKDNLYVNGCLEDASIKCGYERIATLPRDMLSYQDTDVLQDVDYYYYLQGVGEPQPADPDVMDGTPGGLPLRSGRYLTQTHTPVFISAAPAEGEEVMLGGNYPNPFIETTRITYALPAAMQVKITVYDTLGREVAVLVDAFQAAGYHEYPFTVRNKASGVYFYLLEANQQRTLGKMVLMR